MPAPNLFLIYVTDVRRATDFYRDLFEIEPLMTTTRYVPFEVAPGVLFALWSGRSGQEGDAREDEANDLGTRAHGPQPSRPWRRCAASTRILQPGSPRGRRAAAARGDIVAR